MSPRENEVEIWRTDTNMSALFVSGPTVPIALRTLASALEARDLHETVIELTYVSHHEGPHWFTVGAVVETQ